jgi:hypothetical protein
MGGPGRRGKKLPIRPTRIKIIPSMIQSQSIIEDKEEKPHPDPESSLGQALLQRRRPSTLTLAFWKGFP